MKFCPKCETRMRPKIEEGIALCPKCGFSVDKEKEKIYAKENTISSTENTENSLKVIDSDKSPDILPTTTIECPKCKNNNAFWWMLQTRSADEATTQFYRCTKCSHTWRNYS
ncbi:MAG TPA: transcription factor S [Nitrososphaeraceae archaeon]|nr:transcription factor S [Nitrososphaeraceae archaeon]